MTQNIDNDIKKLQFMAQEFNPFAGEISDEMKLILEELELYKFIDNPFTLSNEILKRLHEYDSVQSESKKTLQ